MQTRAERSSRTYVRSALLAVSLSLAVLSASSEPPSLDATKAERQPVKYFVYDASRFLANTLLPDRDPAERPPFGFDLQYGNDLLFLRDILSSEPGGFPSSAFPQYLNSLMARSGGGAHPFPGVRTGPADAELFIVPVFCTASLVKRSQRNATLFDVVADLSEAEQLHIIWADMVSQLEYLKPGVANHVLVCPHWYADVTFQSDDYPKPPPELLMGTYSAPNGLVGPGDWPTFVVGCSSYEGMQGLTTGKRRSASGTHSLSPTPAAARRYNVSFIGRWETDFPGEPGTYKRTDTDWAVTPGWPDWPGELYRRSFKDFVVRTRVRVPPDFYLPMSTAHTSSFFNEQADPFAAWAATEAVMANSLLCLALPGDQFTTDRIVNAFEAGCVIAALDVDKERLYRQLPFHFAIPWDDLIVWVSADEWLIDPIAALRATVDALSLDQADARLRMIERHRPDMSWSSLDSRATHNVLVAARSTADGTAARFPACAERVRCAPPNDDALGCFACAPVANA